MTARRAVAEPNGPIITADGTKEWRNKDGKLHRVDGPAVEDRYGRKEWWVDGKKHRLGGLPAVEDRYGKEWWVDGKYCRVDGGPVIERTHGHKEWRNKDGKLHRVDGPAVEFKYGNEWFVDGEELTEAEFRERIVSREAAQQEAERAAVKGEIMSNPSYRNPFKSN